MVLEKIMSRFDEDPEVGRNETELRQRVLDMIAGGAWHTTSEERFRRILEFGAILPEVPGMPQSERWGAALDHPYVNYVRGLGGVSLFEFIDFVPEVYDEKFPMSSWRTFVPMTEKWGHAVWIEVDRERLGANFLSAATILDRWKIEKSVRRFMPMIEAAHLGPLPVTAFIRAFIVRKGIPDLMPLALR